MADFQVRTVMKLCVICCFVGLVAGTGFGKCPIYPSLPHFDMHKMIGTWYEVERSFYLVEMTASCTELKVSLNNRGYFLIAVNTVNRWTGSPSTSYGVGIPNFNGSSTFRYKVNNRMPYMIGRMLPGAGQYNILFTDYTRFAIVWSCSSVSVAHADRMWVVSRSREIEAAVRAQIYAIMIELRLDPDRLILSKNNNCSDTIN